MGVLDRFNQSPDETIRRYVDYSGWLDQGESLVSVVTTVAPVTTPAFTCTSTNTATRVALLCSGGVDNVTYAVNVTITTSQGQVKEDCIEFICEDEC